MYGMKQILNFYFNSLYTSTFGSDQHFPCTIPLCIRVYLGDK